MLAIYRNAKLEDNVPTTIEDGSRTSLDLDALILMGGDGVVGSFWLFDVIRKVDVGIRRKTYLHFKG